MAQSQEKNNTMEEANIFSMNTRNSDSEKLSTQDAATRSLEAKPAPTETELDEKQYPKLRKVIPVMAGLYLSLFLISLVSFADHRPSKAKATNQGN
jgi:hypothetical protein